MPEISFLKPILRECQQVRVWVLFHKELYA